MSELEPVSGTVVPVPPAGMRCEDEPGAVARVFVRVEYADGRIREYQAVEPQDFEIREGMTMRPAQFPGFGAVLTGSAAFPSLRLSFKAHPRWNLHIRTEATAPQEFEGITYR